MKSKSAAAADASAPSKREARAENVLAKLKKRARLEERLLSEPVAKEKKKGAGQQGAAGDEANDGGGEDVMMSSTLQAAKVNGGGGLRFYEIVSMFVVLTTCNCRHCYFDNQAMHTPAHPPHHQFLLLMLLLLLLLLLLPMRMPPPAPTKNH